MNNKTITLFSILISVLFIIAVLYMAIGILFDAKRGALTAQTDFNMFITEVQHICSSPQDTNTLYTQIQRAALNKQNFASVSLTDQGQTIQLTTNRMVSTSSPFLNTYSLSVLEYSGRQIAVTASVFTLRNIDIFYRARTAFLLILAGTLVTGIVITFLSFTSKEKIAEQAESSSEDDSFSSHFQKTGTADTAGTAAASAQAQQQEDTDGYVKADAHIVRYDAQMSDLQPEPEAEVQAEQNEQPAADNGDADQLQMHENKAAAPEEQAGGAYDALDLTACEEQAFTEPEPVQPQQEAEPQDMQNAEDDREIQSVPEFPASEEHAIFDDNDLPTSYDAGEDIIPDPFSSVSGFMREPLLEPKLDIILDEAAASQNDVTLAIIQITDLDYTGEPAQRIYAVLEQYFEKKENIFEYGDDCFAGIFIDKNTDDALAAVEQMHADIITAGGSDMQVCIGLSSRSMRLISSQRIIIEAAEALRHAQNDPESPIIAFRVDPEKYRQYIAAAQQEQLIDNQQD